MAMALAHPDINQAFASQVEDILGTSLSRTNSNTGSNSGSTSAAIDDSNQLQDLQNGPILIRFLSNRDLFPIVVGYLDTRSLLSLTSISTRFRREILMPATPNLCCLNQFLQQRTVVCPMAQFESLKDFMVKYRSFKPLHLHFTYSEQSSLMSLMPEAAPPIYNSRQDLSFVHPTTSSPHTSSPVYGVNNSISINITSTNSLYQHHHHQSPALQPAQLSPQPQPQQPQLPSQHSQREDVPGTTSSLPDSSTSTALNNANNGSNIASSINSSSSSSSSSNQTSSTSLQHAAVPRLQEMRTSNNNCIDSAIGYSSESSSDRKDRNIIESKDDGKNRGLDYSSDLGPKAAAMTLNANPVAPTPIISSQQQQQQQQQQHSIWSYNQHDIVNNTHSVGSSSSSSSSSNSSGYPIPIGNNADAHSSSGRSDSIPVLSSSLNSISPPFKGHGHHGFELSYWQRFALNELFMRLLPFIKTLTIGRTDKPSRRTRAQRANGELSAGVCFFLARCFNVMHDMPDTELESVLWMDVTPKDVALLVTMIQLRDIMVDERYWRRGYWAADHPSLRGDDDEQDGSQDGYSDDEDDWDGFYYLINQEGTETKLQKPLLPPVSASAGKTAQRKATIRNYGKQSKKSSSSSSSPSPTSAFTSVSVPTTHHASSTSADPEESSGSGSSSSSSSTTTPYGTSSRKQGIASPAAWQGFGDGGSETNGGSSLFPETEVHSAVQLYEAIKVDICDSAVVARTLDKGKHLANLNNSSGSWVYDNTTRTAP
ncbi:MAG: hypothetical protein J3Q66DRAFT_323355 [Benniella sp.]|nr:MAG: hypothetical protein J3Q66DRAFT_323355 [Benniella sp.]